eukprot:CAMPEP_0184867564 /NCGR_PEP_ID=MMETSP0580-20130426/27055_1 /TAXON_ID=1118495 /ORGANISM="Dactyliosolen fragilissimus" /LENGTH=864 /DNA_ID=CAMNT_0027367925 /DNA_START=108 /DNA_END=2702 /DNA_ORIENTATION=-
MTNSNYHNQGHESSFLAGDQSRLAACSDTSPLHPQISNITLPPTHPSTNSTSNGTVGGSNSGANTSIPPTSSSNGAHTTISFNHHQSQSPSSISATNMSNTNFSGNSTSQTLITAHVHHKSTKSRKRQTSLEIDGNGKVIAESPPILDAQGQTSTIPTPNETKQASLPQAAKRSILSSTNNAATNTIHHKRKSIPVRNAAPKKRGFSPNMVSSTDPVHKKKTKAQFNMVSTTPTNNEDPSSINANVRKRTIPPQSIPSSSMVDTQQHTIATSANVPKIEPLQSESTSNPPVFSTKKNGSSKPIQNTTIKNFFVSKRPSNVNTLVTSNNMNQTNNNQTNLHNFTVYPFQTSSNTITLSNSKDEEDKKEIASLKETIISLRTSLADKTAQLKAVSNNQTILHASLKSALAAREVELTQAKKSAELYYSRSSEVIEHLVRSNALRDATELRQQLASDGARLGRLVYNRVGMHTVEGWEDGEATQACKRRRAKLKRKRDCLQLKQGQVSNGDTQGMEREELDESIRCHLEEIKREERVLDKEEERLYKEKAMHIRSLKKVASEDGSRFKNRPKLHDQYILLSQLGKGGFSEVWRAYDLKELREVAVKIHQLDPRWSEAKIENYTKHVAREYEIHRDVRHPRIVSLYDVFEIDTNSFATVLECCNGTDLDTLLKERKILSERHARAILLQILSGMKYLSTPSQDKSRQGIIHYDLKPGNILFDELGDAKITDFGLSKIMDSPDPGDSMELTSQGAGTYWYLPPECFITNQSVKISNKVDVWSIGVIFYQMLFGKRPFGDGQSQEKVLSNNIMLNAREVIFPEIPIISDICKDFIRHCLTYEYQLRPNISDLCAMDYVKSWKMSANNANS